ncbi:hypothetical protein PQR57_41895 [Paraburkholderia dipogonis]|uniref:Uncharacterized protein n=1 Tax=Paraburkholderia dipogonis TaxID=1211383 RepID=A0ABW9B7Z1_9BURK
MAKKTVRDENTQPQQEPRRGHESSAHPATVPAGPERKAGAINFIELRPGLFLNVDHIVSVRVLPQEEGEVYAILQLSNGDKQHLTRGEFSALTGEEPRLLARLPQKPPVE